MSVAATAVLEVDQLQVLTDGGYSNAEEVARCERENIEVAAQIKRGAMNSEHFRPVQFLYDEDSDTNRCPGGQTLRPSGIHTRNRAIRYRTSVCMTCALKPKCTPGAQLDLTPAEDPIARAFAEGHSVESSAAALSISPETVRTQLKRVMAKTGTSRQAELVQLLAGTTSFPLKRQ